MLRALKQPETAAEPAQDHTLVAAIEGTRKEFLAASRRQIAATIDAGGVPAHALARLINEMDRIDLELRTRTVEEVEEGEEVQDGPFDPDLI